jgi:hypothetical protein
MGWKGVGWDGMGWGGLGWDGDGMGWGAQASDVTARRVADVATEVDSMDTRLDRNGLQV